MNRRPVGANFASMTMLRIGMAAMTFGLFWMLSHRLSTLDLGGFSLLMNTFFLVQSLPLLGMTMPLIRRIAAEPGAVALETSNSFIFALPVAIIIGAAVAATGHWYAAEGLIWPFALLGVSIIPTAWTVVAEAVLMGQEVMYPIAYVNVLEAFGRLVGGWIVIYLGLGLIGVFAVFVVLRCAAALAYLRAPELPLPRWRDVRKAVIRRYVRETPVYLSIAVVTALCTRVDVILVSKLLSLGEAGIYAAAARLNDAALMVPTMAAIVLFPSQARLFEANRPAFARMLERGIRWLLVLGFGAALVVVALSPFIIHLLYAPKLAAAAPVLQTLILGATLMVIDQMLSTTMMAARAQHADLQSMALGSVLLVTLLVAFTHWFGLRGAGLAAPLALMARVLYRVTWAQRQFASPLLFVTLRILAAAAIAIMVYFSQWTTSAAGDLGLSLAVYVVMLWVTGATPRVEWLALRQMLNKRTELEA